MTGSPFAFSSLKLLLKFNNDSCQISESNFLKPCREDEMLFERRHYRRGRRVWSSSRSTCHTCWHSAKNCSGHALHSPNDSSQQSLRLLLCLAPCACVCNVETLILGVCILSLCVTVCVKSHVFYSCSGAKNHPVRFETMRMTAPYCNLDERRDCASQNGEADLRLSRPFKCQLWLTGTRLEYLTIRRV